MRGRGLAQSLLGRSWNRADIHGLTGDLGVVEVLFSLGLIGHIAACACVCVVVCVFVCSRQRERQVDPVSKKRELFVCVVTEYSTHCGLDVKSSKALHHN